MPKKRYIALAAGGLVAAVAAAKMLTRAKTVDWDAAAELVPHSDRSRFVTLDGVRVHLQEFGDEHAPPMILIHGFTASVYVWHTAAPMLAEKGFRVIAVDLLGFGYSEKPASFDYTISSQARMISRLMDRLGIGRAMIVGSSYGGAVAATLALDYAGRVEKLVLVDAVINDEAILHPLLRLARLKGVGELLTPFLSDSPRFFRRRMRSTFAEANHSLITDERVQAIRRPLAAADAHRSVLATSRAWDACRVERDAHRISQPTLIIWGDSDRVIKLHNGHKLHAEIAHSRFLIFNDCGHVPPEEKPDLFVDVVSDFCAGHESKSIDSAL